MTKTRRHYYDNLYKKKNVVKRFKYIKLILIFLFLSTFISIPQLIITSATNESNKILAELSESVSNQLKELDLNELEKIVGQLNEDEKNVFGADGFFSKLMDLLGQNYTNNSETIFNKIIALVFGELLKFIPILATICAIAVLSSFLGNLRGKSNSSSIGEIIHFVCYGVVIVLVTGCVISLIDSTQSTISLMKKQMDIIFPILLTMLTAVGGLVSVSVYKPAVAMLCTGVVQIFEYILFPLFLFSFIFTIVGNLSNNIKLNKFISFFNSSFKWIIGTVLTLFLTILAFQGITASSYDGISIKTAKYAIKSYVPLIGGHLSDGFNLIMSSSILIKNALGVTGLFLLLSTIVLPVIKIVILGLGLKLTSAIIEPVVDKRISDFIYGVSKSLNFLVATILAIAFMYLIVVGLVICTGNIFT